MQDSNEDIQPIVEENDSGPHNVGINKMNRFMVSGVRDDNLLEELKRKVQDLGGNILDTRVFVSVINSVLTHTFTLSEKILGALAAGFWILKVEYVIDSSKAGCWLKREDYEWGIFDEVAKYCRLRRRSTGRGMFAGWAVYAHLEPGRRKCFSRVICGGGGRVCTKEDLRRRLPDFVLVEKKNVEEARALVGPKIPLVDTSFIIETLVMKKDPRDIKPYIIDTEESTGDEAESRLMGDIIQDAFIKGPDNTKDDNHLMSQEGNKQHVHKTGLSGIKRPYKNGEVSRNEKTSTSRQQSIGGLSSNSIVPMKNESVSPSDSPRKKKCKRYSSDKCGDIRAFVNTGNDLRDKRSEHVVSDDSDIVITNEEPTISDRIDSSGVNLQTSKMKQKKNNIERTGSLDFLDKKIEEKENVCNLSLTSVGSESYGHSSRVSEVLELDELPSGKGDGRVTNSIDKTHLTQNEILENYCEKSVKSVSSQCLKSSTSNRKKVREWSNFNMVITVPTMSHKTHSEVEMSHRKEMDLVLKCLETNDSDEDFQLGEISYFSCLSLSSSSNKGLHFNSNDIKSVVMTLVKKQRMSCSTLTKVIQPCYPNRSNLAIVVLDDQESEPEEVCTELALEETAFFEESTDEDATGADEEIILDGIDSLFLNISIRKFPPAWIMGRILSHLALKVDSELVHQRAIDLAYQILTLHPPSSTKKRLYYYTALSFGMQAGPDHNRAWLFVQDVISSSLTLKTAGGETPNEAQRASELLQFLLTLLQQDFQMWDRRIQNVFSLITVQLLWGECTNLDVITQNIKDLIKLWVDSVNSTPEVQSFLGGLMSVLLEIVVAGTNIISIAGNQILLTSYILPITIYMQDLDMNLKMKLVGNLSSPWIRSLVYRTLLCEIHEESGQELTRIGLKAMLKKSEEVVFGSQTKVKSVSKASPRKKKCSLPIRVAIQPEDYGELLVAAVSSYVTHMELMSICSLLYAITQRKTSRTSDDLVLLEENSVEKERVHKIVEKLFPIIQSDLAVVQNPENFLDKIDLPLVKDLLMFSLSR